MNAAKIRLIIAGVALLVAVGAVAGPGLYAFPQGAEGIRTDLAGLPRCKEPMPLPVATQRVCIDNKQSGRSHKRGQDWQLADVREDRAEVAKTSGKGNATVVLENTTFPCVNAWVYVVMHGAPKEVTFASLPRGPDPDGRTVRIVTGRAAWSYSRDWSAKSKAEPYDYFEAGYPSKGKMLPLKTATVALWVGYDDCGGELKAARRAVRGLLDRIDVSDADCIDPTEFRPNLQSTAGRQKVAETFVRDLCVPRPDAGFTFAPGSWKDDVSSKYLFSQSARFVSTDDERLGVFIGRYGTQATFKDRPSTCRSDTESLAVADCAGWASLWGKDSIEISTFDLQRDVKRTTKWLLDHTTNDNW